MEELICKWNDIICRKVKELFMIPASVVLLACRKNNQHLKTKLEISFIFFQSVLYMFDNSNQHVQYLLALFSMWVLYFSMPHYVHFKGDIYIERLFICGFGFQNVNACRCKNEEDTIFY
jgi:hypothetical protein